MHHSNGLGLHNLFRLEEPAVEALPRLIPMHTLRPRCFLDVSTPLDEGRLRRVPGLITGRGLYRSEDW